MMARGQPRSATTLSVRTPDILCSGSWSREIGDGSNLGGIGLEAIRNDKEIQIVNLTAGEAIFLELDLELTSEIRDSTCRSCWKRSCERRGEHDDIV
jgi:hypothetical protein